MSVVAALGIPQALIGLATAAFEATREVKNVAHPERAAAEVVWPIVFGSLSTTGIRFPRALAQGFGGSPLCLAYALATEGPFCVAAPGCVSLGPD